jgi:hypothetical protein
VSANDSGKTAPVEEKDLKLSEHVGVLVFSLILFFGDGALIVANWGKLTTGFGAVLAILGFIVGGTSFMGILKCLWQGVRGKK